MPSVKDILIEMKDMSELMVDLAYSAVLFNNKAAAEEVDAKILAIGMVFYGDKARIAEAREAYDALNGTALTFVTKGGKLQRAEFILKALQTWLIPVMAVFALGVGFAVVIFAKRKKKQMY